MNQTAESTANSSIFFILLGHNVLIYCSDLIGVIGRKEARDEHFLMEVLHLTPREEMTQ